MKKIYLKSTIAIFTFVMSMALNIQLKAQSTQTLVYTGSMQQFTVPPCVSIMTITAVGAAGSGGNGTPGGLGARMIGTFTCTPGQVLKILAGGQGTNVSTYSSGGGGGTFVSDINNVPWIVAGGGGGTNGTPVTTMDATVGINGLSGNSPSAVNNIGVGGTNGNGASGNLPCAGNGGGFFSDGVATPNCCNNIGGAAFINGGAGAPGGCGYVSPGGYGGGGGGGNWGCGGGGGYSGGGANYHFPGNGGGGGSFNGGTNQSNSGGISSGHGSVIISYFPGLPMTFTMSPTLGICSGGTATLTATPGMLSYTWSTNSNATSITVNPLSTTSYTVQGTNPQGCITTGIITVTVSSGLPVLSVSTSTNQTCLGKTVTLTATGAQSYTWTNNVTNGASYSPSVTNTYTVSGQNGCGTTTAVTTISVAPLPITAMSSPTLICASKPVTLTAVGPATGFTWTPFPAALTGTQVTINPSVTTLFTVTATDGTCAGTATVLVTANPNPTVGISATATQVCEGYPVNLTASGGVTYTWLPGGSNATVVTVNPTAPIAYTVLGSNNLGCVSVTTQIVLTNSSPTINIAASSTFVCANTAVNIIATGGNGYMWGHGPTTSSVSVNPATTTIYTVTGTAANNTCTATRTIEVTVFIPSLTSNGSGSICLGNTISLSASGTDNYSWDNGSNANLIVVSPSVTTVYTVTGTSFSNNVTCGVTNTLLVTVVPKPNVTAAATNSSICKGETTTLTGAGATSYTWQASSGINTSSVSITITPTLAILYTYTVVGIDANGCINTATQQINVKGCVGIGEVTIGGTQLFIYPNPNKGEFTLQSDSEVDLVIINELGQTVKTISLTNANHNKVQVSELANGIYFVKGENKNGAIMQRIVVNK